MSDMWWFKKAVLEGKAYDLEQPAHEIKVNQNENPYEIPRDLKGDILLTFMEKSWSRYPPFVPDELHGALGVHYGFPGSWILAGNGSNELLQAIFATTIEPGDKVVGFAPTFSLYALLTRLGGGDFVTIDTPSPFRVDVEQLAALAVKERAKVTLACSPNNPTGFQLAREEVLHLVRAAPGLVVVDEAYVEFASHSVTDMVGSHENLVVLRTFSKALSMAGLRVGCAIAHPAVLTQITKGKLPYNINTFSVTAVTMALRRHDLFAGAIRQILHDRERLHSALSAMGRLRVIPSQANFLLVHFAGGARAAYLELLKRGILVRDVSSNVNLADHLRLSVGTTAEVDRMIAALKEFT